MIARLAVALIASVSLKAVAAPMPVTGGSVLADTTKASLFQGYGFSLKTAGTDWIPVHDDKETIFQTIRIEPKKKASESSASLSIRMDKLKEATGLESYARKWMRDYPNYGFQVLGTKSFNLGGGKGLVVDLVQKSKNKQLRQVILQKDQRVAVVTCLDEKDRFSETLQSCNQIVKSFEWQ